MLELLGQASFDMNNTGQITSGSLLKRMEDQTQGENSDEMEFLIGKSIDVLKDLHEQISQLKIMAVQMNNQIHQFDSRSSKVITIADMLQKLMEKYDLAEHALHDYYQMLQDLPLSNNE